MTEVEGIAVVEVLVRVCAEGVGPFPLFTMSVLCVHKVTSTSETIGQLRACLVGYGGPPPRRPTAVVVTSIGHVNDITRLVTGI